MSIQPLFEEIRCPYCQNGLIRKLVSCEFKNRENYLEGLAIITTYICLRCQTIVDQEIRDFSLQKSREFAHHQT